MSIGYDKPLYILPFDHRGSLPDEDVRLEGQADPRADGARSPPPSRSSTTASRPPWPAACRRSRPASSSTSSSAPTSSTTPWRTATRPSCPAEKSGQDEFDFEYGDDFGAHIEKFNPTFCKVLVRYNPEGDAALNRARRTG